MSAIAAVWHAVELKKFLLTHIQTDLVITFKCTSNDGNCIHAFTVNFK